MSRGGDGTLKGDTSGHYNLHILPSGQQTVDAENMESTIFRKTLHFVNKEAYLSNVKKLHYWFKWASLTFIPILGSNLLHIIFPFISPA